MNYDGIFHPSTRSTGSIFMDLKSHYYHLKWLNLTEINLLICIYILQHLPMCLLTAVEEYDTTCTPYTVSVNLSHTHSVLNIKIHHHQQLHVHVFTVVGLYFHRAELRQMESFQIFIILQKYKAWLWGEGTRSLPISLIPILSVINIHSNQQGLCTRYCIVL